MDKPEVEYIGRFDFEDDSGPRFGWSASTISANFWGTSVSVRLKSFGRNYFVVLVDDEIITPSLKLKEDTEETYSLIAGLEEEKHKITLFKRTEFNIGSVQFKGFDFKDGRLLPKDPNKKLRLEIIGDSISCGFGIEGDNPDIEYDPKYDNSYYSYGSVAARELDAEHRIIACSGFGLVRNYGGEMVNTMPKMYSHVIPNGTKEWDYSKWQPDAVVINLGTNDFSEGYLPTKELFVGTYIKFVSRMHKNYLKAKIICSIGPVIEGRELEITRRYVKEEVVDALRKENNDWIYFLEFNHQLDENGRGISNHPSLKTHFIDGKFLAKKIKEILHL